MTWGDGVRRFYAFAQDDEMSVGYRKIATRLVSRLVVAREMMGVHKLSVFW